MPTYYVNDHNARGRTHRRGAWYIGYTTGSGDDTHASPCDYGYTRWIKESAITNKKSRGFCNMGGRGWAITTRSGLVEGDDTFLEKNEVEEQASDQLPDNVKNMFVGNGHIVWTVDAGGSATSIAFVPSQVLDVVEEDEA
ncbi:hypothetical protein AB6C71_22600 [Vibrio splendidus]